LPSEKRKGFLLLGEKRGIDCPRENHYRVKVDLGGKILYQEKKGTGRRRRGAQKKFQAPASMGLSGHPTKGKKV